MQRKYLLVLIGLLLLIAFSTGYIRINPNRSENLTTQENQQIIQPQTGNCTPTFADGGGPYYKLNSPFRNKISPEVNNGEKLIVSGKFLRNDCKTTVSNAVLDIWQANESGNYEDQFYRGKVRSDNEGNYLFETVIPKGYGEGTGYRPPHIHFKVFVEDREIITSQMFFPQVKGTPGFNDAYIMNLERKTESGSIVNYGSHNIILP